jgi:glycosyltransferase involved in cell wall biosynthesis
VRVALVHYWLVNHRGGEKVLEAICRIFPAADIYTLFYDPAAVSPLIRSKNIHASFLNPLRKMYRSLLPLMPMALESFDLRPYDLVISSESGPAKGVLTSSTTRHFCYCHTPMRYLWELYPAHRNDFPGNPIVNALFAPVSSYLRTWDFATAARVDGFMANSLNVKRRIAKTYRRASRIVYPPVATESFRCERPEGYSLIVSEMVPYKRLDYVVRMFARTGRRLKIAGAGPQDAELKRMAASNIEFCGAVRATISGCSGAPLDPEWRHESIRGNGGTCRPQSARRATISFHNLFTTRIRPKLSEIFMSQVWILCTSPLR